jgi:hypothetical protein
MKTEIYFQTTHSRITRVESKRKKLPVAVRVDPELEHLDTELWERLQPMADANQVVHFASEEAACEAGALVQRIEPHR